MPEATHQIFAYDIQNLLLKEDKYLNLSIDAILKYTPFQKEINVYIDILPRFSQVINISALHCIPL